MRIWAREAEGCRSVEEAVVDFQAHFQAVVILMHSGLLIYNGVCVGSRGSAPWCRSWYNNLILLILKYQPCKFMPVFPSPTTFSMTPMTMFCRTALSPLQLLPASSPTVSRLACSTTLTYRTKKSSAWRVAMSGRRGRSPIGLDWPCSEAQWYHYYLSIIRRYWGNYLLI